MGEQELQDNKARGPSKLDCSVRFSIDGKQQRSPSVLYMTVNVPAVLKEEVQPLKPAVLSGETHRRRTHPVLPDVWVCSSLKEERDNLQILSPNGFHQSVRERRGGVVGDGQDEPQSFYVLVAREL